MASGKSYLEFILEQLSDLEEISCRAMYEELPAPKKKSAQRK